MQATKRKLHFIIFILRNGSYDGLVVTLVIVEMRWFGGGGGGGGGRFYLSNN